MEALEFLAHEAIGGYGSQFIGEVFTGRWISVKKAHTDLLGQYIRRIEQT
jgi:hypothetical protein